MLEIRNVTKIYKSKSGAEVKALDDVSISFPETGMVFILGKSGSGKSTLLNVIGGLDGCDDGEFVIKGKSSRDFGGSDFDAYRNTFVGFIFQEYNILDDFTVGANIGLALELQGKKADSAKISEILGKVELLDYAKRKPNELSGGQKQRIAIARALVKDPEIIMADEPTGALDSNTGKQIFDTLKELSKTKLVIVVSHDRDFAERYGDRVIEMMDGKVYSDVTKHEVAAENLSLGILKMNDNLLRIEKGYQLTPLDVMLINDYLRTRNTEIILSSDERLNEGVRSAAGISERNTSSVFKNTVEAVDVKKKSYTKEDARFIRSRLPMKNAMKIGGSSLGHKKFRLVVTILLSLIAFSLFGFADTMGAYNKYTATVQSIRDSNVPNASFSLGVRQTYTYPDGDSHSYYMSASMNDEDLKFLEEKLGMDFIPVYNGSSYPGSSISLSSMMQKNDNLTGAYTGRFYGFVSPEESELSSLGFSVRGEYPNEAGEVAITKLVYEQFAANGYRDYKENIEIAPENLTMNEDGSASSILGKKLYLNVNGFEVTLKITGVIDTCFDYDRYAAFIPNSNGQSSPEGDTGIMDYVMQEELRSTMEYGFHSLAYMSEEGLETLTKSIPTYQEQTIGTYMNWDTKLRRENPDYVEGFEDAGYFNRVADSSVLSSLDVIWLDGTPRTQLGKNEMVISSDILNRISMDVSLREKMNAMIFELVGMPSDPVSEEESQLWYYRMKLIENAAVEKIDDSRDTLIEIFYGVGYTESVNDNELLMMLIDNYRWVSREYPQLGLKSEDEIIAEGYQSLIKAVMGIELPDNMPSGFYESVASYMDGWISPHSMTDILVKIYAYEEIMEKGEALYGAENFYSDVMKPYYGVDEESWNNADEQEKKRFGAEGYAQYVMYGTRDGINIFGGKTCSDFEGDGEDLFFEVADIDLVDLLDDFYLHVSKWMDGSETSYRDYKIVGLFDNGSSNNFGWNSGSDLIVSDSFAALYEEYRVENNIGKEEMYPHAAGVYAFAVAPMPFDDGKLMELVQLSYNESEGLSFKMQNQVMNTLGFFNEFIEIGAKVFLWVGVGFAVFSALMLMNFISVSISYKRREIGILRAVGARSSDVFKIFFCEAFMIALINYVLSLATTVAAVVFLNNYVRTQGLNVTLLNFGVRQIVLMFAISLFVAAVASFFPVWNIARRKPVDAIKNK